MAKDRNLFDWFLLYLKGICMGAADVIPGVSGGTMALVLGIYRELIEALSSLDLQWLKRFFKTLFDWSSPFLSRLVGKAKQLKVFFFLVLGAGIFSAISVGSAVIPALMQEYPAMVRGFFFGLIVGSVWIPLQRVEFAASYRRLLLIGVILFFILFGFWVTAPHRTIIQARNWVKVQSQGKSLETLLFQNYSAAPSKNVLASPKNSEIAAQINNSLTGDNSKLPPGTTVYIPRPPAWYVLLAGSIAICAMILPGISGSYLLLILGCYTFILRLVHLFESRLIAGVIPGWETFYLVLFGLGMVGGLLLFSRFLNYMLHHYESYTMAALVGLMVGCLRGLWPYRTLPVGGYFGLHSAMIVCLGIFGALLVYFLGYLTALDRAIYG